MKLDIEIDRLEELQAIVASGRFASVEEAVNAAVGRLVDEEATADDEDLSWAKPYIDEAEAQIERGEVVSLDEAKRRIRSHLDQLSRK